MIYTQSGGFLWTGSLVPARFRQRAVRSVGGRLAGQEDTFVSVGSMMPNSRTAADRMGRRIRP